MDLTFNKSGFDIEKINSEFKSFCTLNNIRNDVLIRMELVNEEFLSNILFPNYENEIKLSVFQKDNDAVLSYEYSGVDYMNKINETTVVSLKIIQNKTKDIISNTQNGKTTVSFIV